MPPAITGDLNKTDHPTVEPGEQRPGSCILNREVASGEEHMKRNRAARDPTRTGLSRRQIPTFPSGILSQYNPGRRPTQAYFGVTRGPFPPSAGAGGIAIVPVPLNETVGSKTS